MKFYYLGRMVVWKPDVISVDFGDFSPSFSRYLMISWRSYIKHSK